MSRKYLVIMLLGLFVLSCNDTTNCPVIYKYSNIQTIALQKDSTAKTFFNNVIKLGDINYIRTIKKDTIYSQTDTTYRLDTLYTSIKAVLNIRNDTSKYNSSITVPLNDSALAGYREPGKYYCNIKIFCDSVNLKKKTAYLRIYNSSFLQDCTDWK